MKKVALVVIVAFLFVGCAQQVYLKKSPSELVLTSIKSDNNKKVSYTFTSRIPDVLELRDYYQFDVNATYISNLKIYMNTKYSVMENDSVKIEFILISCSQTMRNANSGLQNTSNVLGALAGSSSTPMYTNIALTTEINLKVIVKKGESVLSEKDIFTTDEYNGNNNNSQVAAASFDQAIGKSIIMIDKFLTSLEI